MRLLNTTTSENKSLPGSICRTYVCFTTHKYQFSGFLCCHTDSEVLSPENDSNPAKTSNSPLYQGRWDLITPICLWMPRLHRPICICCLSKAVCLQYQSQKWIKSWKISTCEQLLPHTDFNYKPAVLAHPAFLLWAFHDFQRPEHGLGSQWETKPPKNMHTGMQSPSRCLPGHQGHKMPIAWGCNARRWRRCVSQRTSSSVWTTPPHADQPLQAQRGAWTMQTTVGSSASALLWRILLPS